MSQPVYLLNPLIKSVPALDSGATKVNYQWPSFHPIPSQSGLGRAARFAPWRVVGGVDDGIQAADALEVPGVALKQLSSLREGGGPRSCAGSLGLARPGFCLRWIVLRCEWRLSWEGDGGEL